MDAKQLERLLMHLYHSQSAFRKKYYQEHYNGLNVNEVHTLVLMEQEPEKSMIEIAQRLQITKGALSKVVHRLCEEGYCELYQKADNKKIKYSLLLAKGKEIVEKHQAFHRSYATIASTLWSERNEGEQAIIADFLLEFKSILEEETW